MNRPTPKMHFVFVHGWGFNPAIWRDVIRNIGNAEVTLIDLGFIAGGPKAAATWPSDAIAVGHSLGLLWLLHRAGEEEGHAPFRGLVSLQGFDRFCPHIPPSRVAGMRRGLRRDAGQTIVNAEQVAKTFIKAEASASEFLIGPRALLDGLVEDHHAEGAFSGSALRREDAQVCARFVSGPVRSLIEFDIQFKLAVARIENRGDSC